MKLRHRFILVPAAITIAALIFPQPLRSEVRATAWEVCGEDVPSSKEDAATCAKWRPVTLPLILKVEGPPDGTVRSYHFRSELEVNEDPALFRGISIGRTGPSESLFINGRCVAKGSFGAATYMPLPAYYLLPEGALIQGTNRICITIDGYAGHFISIRGPVRIQSEQEFELNKFLYDILYIHAPVGIACVCLGFAIALLLYHFLTRREPILVFSSLSLFLLALRIILNYLPYAIVPFGLNYALDWSILPLFFALLIMLVQSIYRSYFRLFNIIVVTLLTASSVLIFFANGTFLGWPLRPAMATTVFIFIVPVFVTLLRRLASMQKNRLRFITSALCLGAACLLAAAEIVLEAAGWSTSNLILIYCSPLFIAIFAVLFGRERMLRNREMDELYKGLRESRGREPTITESSEEKLKRVIAFIDANYQSDISREGLAAAVDLNANYMGTLFKSYTGMRISEYINENRIREAAARLRQGDEKIITIALSVGFESLATFNRAFKNRMGVTPSDYRAGKN